MTGVLDRFRNFHPAGPVAASFLKDRVSTVKAILGPVGGGKSVTCIFDSLMSANDMPVCRDGAIRFRLPIIGETYGQIERNLLPTWREWLPEDGGEWTEAEFVGGGGRHAIHRINFDIIRDGCRIEVHFEAIFAAIGEHSIERFMRGFEPTAFWLYEMDLLPRAVLDNALLRIGRYPKQVDLKEGALFRPYIIGDLNAPDIDSWFYDLFEEQRPASFQLFKQPSGRSPGAENIKNLPPGYYDRQVIALASKPRLVKRFVDAQYGPSDDGEPVYTEYSDDLHLAPAPLALLPGVPLRIGLDAGLQRPAAVFTQWTPSGQWRVIDELVPGRMGAKRFADLIAKWLAEHGKNIPIGECYADPAAWSGADKEGGELAWVEILMHELKIPIMPAPSNEIDLRCTAVRDELTFRIDANTPAFWLSPKCKILRKGFVSHYRFTVQRVGQTTRTSDKPEKNDYSHPHDALQYVMLGSKGRYTVTASDKHPKPGAGRAAPRVLSSSWRPFA